MESKEPARARTSTEEKIFAGGILGGIIIGIIALVWPKDNNEEEKKDKTK